MNLYLISQTTNNDYDTYSDAVVCAPDVETARHMNPSTGKPMTAEEFAHPFSSWCAAPHHVKVELIGVAEPTIQPGVICASFHAG